jgi:methionyl-tRNA formyltransferase
MPNYKFIFLDYNKFVIGITSIKEGLLEVKEARRSGKKLQTLKDFLRESNS